MFSRVLRSTVGRRRYEKVLARAAWYETDVTRAEAERFQLQRFNAMWSASRRNVPFYRAWAEEHDLPPRIETLEELRSFPVLTKQIIQERSHEIFMDQHGEKIPTAYSTGGTTGTPTRFPRGPGESINSYANAYVGRSWWGVRPFDSYVHVWGHSHLFGNTRTAKLKRRAQDLVANAERVNAYDMSSEAVASHAQAILNRNPTSVVGYTSAVFKIARHIEDHAMDTSGLTNLRSIIVTAETVTPADVTLIERVFGAPVVIEYGAAETGVLAYSRHHSWPLHVFWRSFIISIENDSSLQITTLDERIFPLVNYAIGDTAEGEDVEQGNTLSLKRVTGRTKDSVTLSSTDGALLTFSAILPVHILKTIPGVSSVQYRQERPDLLRIYLTASSRLDITSVAKTFAEHLKKECPNFDPQSAVFEQVPHAILTRAGKQALFV